MAIPGSNPSIPFYNDPQARLCEAVSRPFAATAAKDGSGTFWRQTMNRKPRPFARKLLAGLLVAGLAAATSGCSDMGDHETAGTILGGIAGAVVGNKFGKGGGNTAATAVGAVIGATVGRNIGKSLDETSRQRASAAAEQALDTASVGEAITWENPDNSGGPAHGSATVTRQGADSEGRTCREFQQTVTIGGRQEQSYGTACRDENGDWKIVSA